MEKIKILLIDSGINTDYYEVEGKIGKCFLNIKEDYKDSLGHGTWCASMITRICKNIEIIPINIYRYNNEMNISDIAGIIKKVGGEVDIVNMSFASINFRKDTFKLLNNVISKVCNTGTLFFASSFGKNHKRSIPSLCKDVYEVRGVDFLEKKEFFFKRENGMNIIYASSENVFSKEMKNKFFSGNSKACAMISGIASDILLKYKKNYNIFEENIARKSLSKKEFLQKKKKTILLI